ncbi:MAG: hypothetical protein U9N82_07995 [Thermodesulfobacteriota bacterium]|nr:hypothetical protein [Thermodesulfobacteriota bacterium]
MEEIFRLLYRLILDVRRYENEKAKNMTFYEEKPGYEKTILSDLQGAWAYLRESVVESFGFKGSDRAIFHIDEAMSWEVVRDLRQMPPLLLVIRNICVQGKALQEVIENINDINDILKEVLDEVHH